MNKIFVLIAFAISAITANASVTLGIDAGKLADRFGTNLPVGSLILLIASTGDTIFQPSIPGSYTSGDDIIVDAFAMNYFGGTAELTRSSVFSYNTVGSASASTFDVGDRLALRWFSSITFAQYGSSTKPVNGDYYGTYTNPSNPDGGIPWIAPADGTSLAPGSGLNFFTTNSGGGGTQSPTAGYASVAVVPEPSTSNFLVFGSIFAGSVYLKRKSSVYKCV